MREEVNMCGWRKWCVCVCGDGEGEGEEEQRAHVNEIS